MCYIIVCWVIYTPNEEGKVRHYVRIPASMGDGRSSSSVRWITLSEEQNCGHGREDDKRHN